MTDKAYTAAFSAALEMMYTRRIEMLSLFTMDAKQETNAEPPNFGPSATGQTCETCEHFEYKRGYEHCKPGQCQYLFIDCNKYGVDFIKSGIDVDFFTYGCDGWEAEK